MTFQELLSVVASFLFDLLVILFFLYFYTGCWKRSHRLWRWAVIFEMTETSASAYVQKPVHAEIRVTFISTQQMLVFFPCMSTYLSTLLTKRKYSFKHSWFYSIIPTGTLHPFFLWPETEYAKALGCLRINSIWTRVSVSSRREVEAQSTGLQDSILLFLAVWAPKNCYNESYFCSLDSFIMLIPSPRVYYV